MAIGALVAALSSPVQAAERVVNFYNWSNYMAPGVLEDFTKETGIKVVYDTFDANETLETRLLAGKSGYDVVVPTAYFLQRQIQAKIFQKLDKSKLPNLANAWPVVTKQLAIYDPGNQYAANYMWGTTGIGYNVKMVQKILGPDAKIDSWDIVFKPENLAKFKDCGIHMLDSADDIFPAALGYLGLDPNSTKQVDLEKAADLVSKIRPSVRKFHSSEYLSALATGEICLVVGWSGDVMQARARAAEAKSDVEIGYTIPKQGAQMFFDNLAIPADAQHVAEAYELINYLYRPEVAAKNSDFLSYANGNLASQKLVDPKILDDKNIYPDEATLKKLFVITARDPATQRIINRLWTKVKTGR
ncbi:MAG TPA: polyamine ABC transporter substrate-binding protein [Bradyrhizobium sp.]|uniref:polyamine ABC transporter substrate-binding protein n=1 Tax=Bradyrhizobium sp. TaxID=376 RepID=UPI002D1AFE27|nr:polyamine ABC transporter substrate-binding protein [Bradyrhizobium sp.]HTB01242.1 polyamine ABC transporter substrate-binding protein [Bradyrhizobium sp.]